MLKRECSTGGACRRSGGNVIIRGGREEADWDTLRITLEINTCGHRFSAILLVRFNGPLRSFARAWQRGKAWSIGPPLTLDSWKGLRCSWKVLAFMAPTATACQRVLVGEGWGTPDIRSGLKFST